MNAKQKLLKFKLLCSILFIGIFYCVIIQPFVDVVTNDMKIITNQGELYRNIPLRINIAYSAKLVPNKPIKGEIYNNNIQGTTVRILPNNLNSTILLYGNDKTSKESFSKVEKKFLIISAVCYVLIIAASITFLVFFIKLINDFRKNIIFNKKNGKRIFIIGTILIINGIIKNFFLIWTYNKAKEQIILSDYTIKMPSLEWDYIIFGFSILIMYEIIKMGINMKEEQELTI